MKDKPKITKIEIHQFECQLIDTGRDPVLCHPVYKPGSVISHTFHALRIFTDIGLTGEYVGGRSIEYAGIPMFARFLIGRRQSPRIL